MNTLNKPKWMSQRKRKFYIKHRGTQEWSISIFIGPNGYSAKRTFWHGRLLNHQGKAVAHSFDKRKRSEVVKELRVKYLGLLDPNYKKVHDRLSGIKNENPSKK